mgnify:CR=1 FL=1
MTDAKPSDPTPTDAPSASGLKGWLRRRAGAALRKPGRASAALTEPGECHVVLQLIGARPIQVIAVIAQATGLDLMSARDLAQDAPVVLVSGISETSADRVVGRLQKAGAKAVVGELYQPQ